MTLSEQELESVLLSKKATSLSREQERAVNLCADLDVQIVGITGGAGTGKTLVLGHVHNEIARVIGKSRIVLCAPTGRAAKRVQELTGIKALTVHRLLEFPQPSDLLDDEEIEPTKPRRNRDNPLDQRVVIVDEASMIGPTLYRQLMDALPKRGAIRFFGDNNQLPPVEEGTPPFVDILKRFDTVELTYNYRSNDAIIGNALRILQGSIPIKNDRFDIFYTEKPLIDVVKYAPREFMQSSHQIITPTRRGKFGSTRLNASLQIKYNNRGDMLRLDRFNENEAQITVRAKDKFLWIKNDYKLEVFNGEIGKIEWIDMEDGSLGLETEDREIVVPSRVKTYSPYFGTVIDYDPRKQIELGYVITTHKAQGSEFDTIIYCMSQRHAFLLGRRNFYTAVTRAKNRVVLITDRRSMGLSVHKRS